MCCALVGLGGVQEKFIVATPTASQKRKPSNSCRNILNAGFVGKYLRPNYLSHVHRRFIQLGRFAQFRQVRAMLFPVPAVERFYSQLLRERIEAANVNAVSIRIRARYVERFDAAHVAECVLSDAGVERVCRDVIVAMQQPEFRSRRANTSNNCTRSLQRVPVRRPRNGSRRSGNSRCRSSLFLFCVVVRGHCTRLSKPIMFLLPRKTKWVAARAGR